MAVAETTIDRPLVRTAVAHGALRSQPVEVETEPARSPAGDAGGVMGLVVGSGILLIQACAVVPGLLPCLLLTLPLVLPLLALGLVAGVLVGVPMGIWRLVSMARVRIQSRSRP